MATGCSFQVLGPDSASYISRWVFPIACNCQVMKCLELSLGRQEETWWCRIPAGRAVPPRSNILRATKCGAFTPTFSWQSSFTARLPGFRSYNGQEQNNKMVWFAMHQHEPQPNLCLPLMGSYNILSSVLIQQRHHACSTVQLYITILFFLKQF